jgi:uncharacterized membrane protein
VLILAKSNAAVAAISRAARERSKAPPQFIARILSGCLVSAAAGSLIGGLLAGAVGPLSKRWVARQSAGVWPRLWGKTCLQRCPKMLLQS